MSWAVKRANLLPVIRIPADDVFDRTPGVLNVAVVAPGVAILGDEFVLGKSLIDDVSRPTGIGEWLSRLVAVTRQRRFY